jgi:malate permease and related proteins
MGGDIFLNVLGPILLMVMLGALLRWKFAIDIGTLSKLNIYLFVPAFIFERVSTSQLEWEEMGGLMVATVLMVVLLAGVVLVVGLLLRLDHRTLAAVALAVMFYNSANYGLPLAELAFGQSGAAAQTFVMMTQSLLTFTLGLAIAAMVGSGQHWGRSLLTVFRLPMLPMLALALLARWWSGGDRELLPGTIMTAARFLANGLVPLALVTLGAQLASNPRWPKWRALSIVLVLRLLVGPMLMAGMLWVFHLLGWRLMDLWPWPAQLLILTAAVPSAVNTLLLTLELDGDADLAADCVFWTTVLSAVTITAWLVALRWFFGG